MFGPFTFPKYSAPLGRIAEKHGVSYHLYADDTQLYVACDPAHIDEGKHQLQSCIAELRDWVDLNKLKLNDTKTEFLVFQSKQARNKANVPSIQVGDSNIVPSTSARNIGVCDEKEKV